MGWIFSLACWAALGVVVHSCNIPTTGQIEIAVIVFFLATVEYAKGYINGKKSVVWSLPIPNPYIPTERKEQ